MAEREPRELVADQAREVARGWSGPDADPSWALVAALFDAVATDDVLADLAAEIPLDRLPALLLVASIQRVVAEHPEDALAAYYPGAAQRPVDDGFAAALHDFVAARTDEVRRWFGHRYQMNEVGRCAQVALALGVVQQVTGDRPLALVDLGTGSGLGLHLDRYAVDLGRGRRFGPAASPVTLHCAVDGEPPLPPGPPRLVARVGIDADPIDLADPAARAWLAACTPPTPDAQRRLAAAMAVTAEAAVPVVTGDGAAAVAAAIAVLPADAVVVLVDSYTAVFFDDAGRAAVRAALDGRDAVWISLDPLVPLGTSAERCVQDLPVPADVVERNRAGGVFAVLSVRGRVGGTVLAELLATAHPSGTRMTWLGG